MLFTRHFMRFLILALFLYTQGSIGAQQPPELGKEEPRENSRDTKQAQGKSASARDPNAVLWREPTDLESRDLFYGAGGAEGAPDAEGQFTFIEELEKGASQKIRVKDDQGREWTVKFAPEARPEVAATRLVWAAGYHVDQDYFVPKAAIRGWAGPIRNVRFERKREAFKEEGLWSWESNPFAGTRELEGLKVLMALLNNWDLKEENNRVLRHAGEDKANPERIYYIDDLGASFGKTGALLRKLPFTGEVPAGTKEDPKGYAKQTFIRETRNGKVVFNYKGKDRKLLDGIAVEDARWMGELLGRLSQKQLNDAFRAAGFDDSNAAVYVAAVQDRIKQLRELK